jgi:hypothetical protein
VETESVWLLFLMFWSSGKRWHWPPESIRKPTYTGRYHIFNSKHPLHAKRGLIQSSQ